MSFFAWASDRCRRGEAVAKTDGRRAWPALKDSNADKFAAVKAALAEKKGIRRIERETPNRRRHGVANSSRNGAMIAAPTSVRWTAARRYCFGGNNDCGGATCIGLDDSSAECATCRAGFRGGTGTGLSAEGGDESFSLSSRFVACKAILCWAICSWMRVSSP